MSFLLRRTKKALAGWYDDFKRPNEPQVLPPWNSWGDTAAFQLLDEKLKLAAEGAPARGGNYDGGVAYEHQPLTPNWVVEFVRAPIGTTSVSSSNETEQNIFLDKNWTEGGNASSTLYQVGLQMKSVYTPKKDPDEDGNGGRSAKMDYNVSSFTRDKTDTSGNFWGFTVYGSIGSDTTSLSATAWAGAVRIMLMVLEDRYLLCFVNGNRVADLVLDLYDERFRFGPRKRSANFAQVRGLVASIDDFKTVDIDPIIRRNWPTVVFEDTFDRENSSTVGNGWTQTAGSWFGIHNNALSSRLGFAGANVGDDGTRQVRRDGGHRDLRIEFIPGGGTGDLNLSQRTAILARMNAAGTKGIACIIHPRSVTVHGFTWTGARTNAPVYVGDSQPIVAFGTDWIDEGHMLSLNIVGDYAWIFNHTLDRLLYFRDGVNALTDTGPDDTWVGAFLRRGTFVNSVPINNYKILA